MGTVTMGPWKQLLLSALDSNSHLKHSSYFQLVPSFFPHLLFFSCFLSFFENIVCNCCFCCCCFQATIGSNGRPSNRTLVFRGFQENTDQIQINTDSRTHKIEDLKHCPFAEICWYFTDSWEQFRINGKIDIIDASTTDPKKLQQRQISWFASSLKSRLQYSGPSPGLPCLSEQPHQDFLDPSTGPVVAFCLLVLDPDQVDYLNLKSNLRVKFASGLNVNGEKCWTSEIINP